jgi:hypothetical protein
LKNETVGLVLDDAANHEIAYDRAKIFHQSDQREFSISLLYL